MMPMMPSWRQNSRANCAAHCVDTAAGDADMAEQQLQDGVGADVLRTVVVFFGVPVIPHTLSES
jgi:hypothetical protein